MFIRNKRAAIVVAGFLSAGSYGTVSWIYPYMLPPLPFLTPFISLLFLIPVFFFAIMMFMPRE